MPAPEPPLQYDDSSVLRYACEVLAATAVTATTAAALGGGGGSAGRLVAVARITGFRQLPGCLYDAALARAYSLDWRPGGGLVAVSRAQRRP